MLKDANGKSPNEIMISKEQYKQIMTSTYNSIKRNLESAKKLVDTHMEMSAGLYTYAIEEFGKIILLNKSELICDKYKIKYKNEFISHKAKFVAAFNYLQYNNHRPCYVINDKGGFDPYGFDWMGYDVGLLADFEARLFIFYSDFVYNKNNEIDIVKIPEVHREMLKKAIDELHIAVDQLNRQEIV